MDEIEQVFGRQNPKAPPALSHFAFLIGRFNGQAKWKSPTGDWQTFDVTWNGRFLLDGYAIADEYTMTDPEGNLMVLGMNLRTFDPKAQSWNIKWLNALTGAWTDLVSAATSAATINSESISYSFKEPMADQTYTRVTFTNISAEHFTWVGEKSDDGEHWAEFMIIDCDRAT